MMMMFIYNLVMTMLILHKISKISSVGASTKRDRFLGIHYFLFCIIPHPPTHPPKLYGLKRPRLSATFGWITWIR